MRSSARIRSVPLDASPRVRSCCSRHGCPLRHCSGGCPTASRASTFYALALILLAGGCRVLGAPGPALPPPFPTTLPAEAAHYTLTFSDEFSGTDLDPARWQPRSLGPRKNGVVVEQASTLNGQGQLEMTLSRMGDEYHIAQVATQKTFRQRFGYFECRARVNHELGAHTAFWLQSPALGEGRDDPARFGTEIDIFEYHLAQGPSWVHHNLHWNGYGAEHRRAGTKVEIAGIEAGFHTFGLLWTAEEYVFYVDGRETWRTTEAVSHIPQYMILSVELTGWGGDVAQAELPDEILFDYVRVYRAP